MADVKQTPNKTRSFVEVGNCFELFLGVQIPHLRRCLTCLGIVSELV